MLSALGRCIGDGAYSRVYQINKDRKEYAKKQFKGHVSESGAFREILALRRLKHENIVGLIDVEIRSTYGKTTTSLIFEFCPTNLSEYIHSNKLVYLRSEDNNMSISKQLLKGIAYMHSVGITHRDIKPENVLLKYGSAGSLAVKICDFGTAQLPGCDMGCYGFTPCYAPPEKFLDEGTFPQSDMWSYGCVLWEIFTQERLFKGDDLKVIGQQIIMFDANSTYDIMKERIPEFELPACSLEKPELKAPECISKLFSDCLQFDYRERITSDQALKAFGLTMEFADVPKYEEPTEKHKYLVGTERMWGIADRVREHCGTSDVVSLTMASLFFHTEHGFYQEVCNAYGVQKNILFSEVIKQFESSGFQLPI